MTDRRSFLAAAALAASATPLRAALAQGAAKEADFLFVQNADYVVYHQTSGKLTL